MARAALWKPQDFGDMPKDAFMDQMVNEFDGHDRDDWTIDDTLLHPRDALWFCDQVRQKHAYHSRQWYDAGMAKTRRSRIGRWTRIAVLTPVLLFVCYLASMFSVQVAISAGWRPTPLLRFANVAYTPLRWYVEAEYPGSGAIVMMGEWARKAGERISQ